MLLRSLVAYSFTLAALAACSDGEAGRSEPTEGNASSQVAVLGLELEAESAGDTALPVAEALWQKITVEDDYTTWPLVEGTTERQDSAAPHGDLATVRHNRPAADGGDVYIIVKENLVEGEEDPVALTVMMKVDGFDSANADWFYVKYLLDGTVDETPGGMPLAGAMEPEPGAACRGCHRGADGDDFRWL